MRSGAKFLCAVGNVAQMFFLVVPLCTFYRREYSASLPDFINARQLRVPAHGWLPAMRVMSSLKTPVSRSGRNLTGLGRKRSKGGLHGY